MCIQGRFKMKIRKREKVRMFIIFATLQYNSMIKIVWEKKLIEIFIIIIIKLMENLFILSIFWFLTLAKN